jgi:hypothetical protein
MKPTYKNQKYPAAPFSKGGWVGFILIPYIKKYPQQPSSTTDRVFPPSNH